MDSTTVKKGHYAKKFANASIRAHILSGIGTGTPFFPLCKGADVNVAMTDFSWIL